MATQPPAERANELIEKLPSSPNLITKTGTALLAAGAAATAISQELYVVNEETIVLVASIIVFTYIGKVVLNFAQFRFTQFSCHRFFANLTFPGHKGMLTASRRFLPKPAPNTLVL